MSSSPKKLRSKGLRVEGETSEVLEPFFTVFGFESIKEEGFPTIDVFENSDHITIEAELPGVGKDRVKISVVDEELIIEGEKTGDRVENERVNYLCIERNFGKFRRTVDIPSAVDIGSIKATFRDGVLVIHIPKVREQRRKNRKIEIE